MKTGTSLSDNPWGSNTRCWRLAGLPNQAASKRWRGPDRRLFAELVGLWPCGFVESGIRAGSRWTSTEVGLSPLMCVETLACGRCAQFSVELVRADASADCGREIGSPKMGGSATLTGGVRVA